MSVNQAIIKIVQQNLVRMNKSIMEEFVKNNKMIINNNITIIQHQENLFNNYEKDKDEIEYETLMSERLALGYYRG